MNIDREIERLIDIAIQEDIGQGDITSEACIPETAHMQGVLIIRQSGMLAGLPYLSNIFKKVDSRIQVELHISEGSYHKAGTAIATIEGPARGILSAERTVLNFVQHASGVASMTANYVRKIAGYDCLILDTRATLPGLRALEKYAIAVAGGTIHRYGLHDRFIIKKNYRTFLAGNHKNPIIEAVRCARAYRSDIPIEVEVSRFEDIDEALQSEVPVIILENMTPIQTRRCVKKIHAAGKKAFIQCSAGISLDSVREFAETEVDGISVGHLASGAENLHISLKLVSNREELKLFSATATTTKRR